MSKITASQIAMYVVERLKSGDSSAAVASQLAGYLLEERRSRDMPMIMRAVELELSRRGTDQVNITSAHTVTEEIKRELATLLGAKNPVFHETIDPTVIGGIKAQAGESIVDLTVRNKLNKLTQIVSNGHTA